MMIHIFDISFIKIFTGLSKYTTGYVQIILKQNIIVLLCKPNDIIVLAAQEIQKIIHEALNWIRAMYDILLAPHVS